MARERPADRGRAARREATEAAVREVYLEHYGQLAGWTARLVGDQDLAHDIATEAFVRLVRDFGSVQDPRPWLYTVSANLVRDHWRRTGRQSAAYRRYAVGNATETDGGIVGLVGASGGLDQATTLSVRDAVQQLPDRLRVAVLLHYFADLPVSAVATALGKPEGTIKRALSDGRAALHVALQEPTHD